jgi:transposase
LAYVEQIPAPTLKKGDIAFMDTVSTHLVDAVEEAIVARDASAFYLPPYSPDSNRIKQLFAKLKSFLRKCRRAPWSNFGKLSPRFSRPCLKANAKLTSQTQAMLNLIGKCCSRRLGQSAACLASGRVGSVESC